MRSKSIKKQRNAFEKKMSSETIRVHYDINDDAFEFAGHNFLSSKNLYKYFYKCSKKESKNCWNAASEMRLR